MKKSKKNNVVNFPSILTNGEREVEAILFAAAEPLDIDTIESKISKNINAKKVLEKEHVLYPKVIRWYTQGRLKLLNNKTVILDR